METIKTIFQAFMLAIVATVIVATLSNFSTTPAGSPAAGDLAATVQTPSLDAAQSSSMNAGLPQE